MATQQLPPDPSFEQLKKQAKDLQTALRSGDAEAAARVAGSHPKFTESAPAEILDARLTLRDAQLVVAREYGFGTWKQLKAEVDGAGTSVARLQQLAVESPEDVARIVRLMLATPPQAATFLYALGQQTTGALMKYLSDAEIDVVVGAIAGLDEVSGSQQAGALAEYDRLRQGGERGAPRINQSNADFAFGALAGAVGRRRANEIFQQQQISASEEMAHPPLSQEYHAKKAALTEKLLTTPTVQLGLDELRQVLVGLAEVARAEGILEFEAFVRDAAGLEGLLRSGLSLIIDGTDPKVVDDMLTTQMQTLVANFETRCKMIIAAVRDTQDGQNPRIIDHKLGGFYEPQMQS